MDDLILRSLRGEISKLEKRMLRNWRLASPENERRYRQFAKVWEIDPSPLPGSVPLRPPTDRIVRDAEARRRSIGSRYRHALERHGRLMRAGAAAAAMVLLGFGLAELRPNRSAVDAFGATELATGSAETVTITLTDGTFVRLAPNSRLRLATESDERTVWLDGRAYFAVESDSSRPFLVRTRAGDALVLGTRFEIRVQESNLRLAVVEGRVALSAGSENVEVGADEVSHVDDGSKPSVIKVENVRELLDWPDGLLVFRSTPLEQVGREVERHFGVRFEITDSVVAQRKLTAWFADESLDEVLTAVCRATGSRCSLEDGRVLVMP